MLLSDRRSVPLPRLFTALPQRTFCLHLHDYNTQQPLKESFEELASSFPKVLFTAVCPEVESGCRGLEGFSLPSTVICRNSHVIASFCSEDQLMQAAEFLQSSPDLTIDSKFIKEFPLYKPYCVWVNGCKELTFTEQSAQIIQRLERLGLQDLAVDLCGFEPSVEEGSILIGGSFHSKNIDSISDEELKQICCFTEQQRLSALINASPVMLFMKGDAEEQKCGFSRQIIVMLQELQERIHFPLITFDILRDEKVRSGLKEYSNWPTYPQLYVRGELIGGLDIVREMLKSGELEEILAEVAE